MIFSTKNVSYDNTKIHKKQELFLSLENKSWKTRRE